MRFLLGLGVCVASFRYFFDTFLVGGGSMESYPGHAQGNCPGLESYPGHAQGNCPGLKSHPGHAQGKPEDLAKTVVTLGMPKVTAQN